jgi:hypothetical protein
MPPAISVGLARTALHVLLPQGRPGRVFRATLGTRLGLVVFLQELGMSLVSDLGDQQQVIAPEAFSGSPMFAILVQAGEGCVVSDTGFGIVLPHYGVDGGRGGLRGWACSSSSFHGGLTTVAEEAFDFGFRNQDVAKGSTRTDEPAMDQPANTFLANAEHGGGFPKRVCEALWRAILCFCIIAIHRLSASELATGPIEASIPQ